VNLQQVRQDLMNKGVYPLKSLEHHCEQLPVPNLRQLQSYQRLVRQLELDYFWCDVKELALLVRFQCRDQ